MDESEALKALAAVDRRMGNSRMAVVDVLLIGASAGMLSGQLPRNRTTTDCDVMDIHPAAAELLLMEAAEAVAHERGLSRSWLNTDAQMLRHALPDGWRTRTVTVFLGQAIRFMAIGRVDLICMKVYAGRAQDLDDLRCMKPSGEELDVVDAYLGMLAAHGEPQSHLEDARTVLAALRSRHAR
jgi:hypothetical protein